MSKVQKFKIINESIVYILDEKQNTAIIVECKAKKKK